MIKEEEKQIEDQKDEPSNFEEDLEKFKLKINSEIKNSRSNFSNNNNSPPMNNIKYNKNSSSPNENSKETVKKKFWFPKASTNKKK